MKLLRSLIALVLPVLALSTAFGQPPSQSPRRAEQKPTTQTQTEAPPPDDEKLESVKIDTNLVTVPVIASSRGGKYIADLTKEEFRVSQDGAPQEIAFLAKVSAPFYVVLLIDTSDSTKDKLGQLQRAATSFVDQLSVNDQVKLISFDGELRDWNDFTSDKALVQGLIKQTKSGHDTRVYDAVQLALNALRPVQQRKAIVLFTDGMDWHSQSATFDATLRDLDEIGVIVYPIRFETRAETERLAREQDAAQNGAQLPTSDVMRRTTTPTTFPTEEPSTNPSGRGMSLPEMILSRPVRRQPTTPQTSPTDPFPETGKSLPPSGPTPRDTRPDDSITALLNQAYLMADSYLRELADRSGGQLYRADTIVALPQAFAAIAAELRTQYLIGYYPKSGNQDGAYHKISVKTSRKDVALRARPGYRARAGR